MAKSELDKLIFNTFDATVASGVTLKGKLRQLFPCSIDTRNIYQGIGKRSIVHAAKMVTFNINNSNI